MLREMADYFRVSASMQEENQDEKGLWDKEMRK